MMTAISYNSSLSRLRPPVHLSAAGLPWSSFLITPSWRVITAPLARRSARFRRPVAANVPKGVAAVALFATTPSTTRSNTALSTTLSAAFRHQPNYPVRVQSLYLPEKHLNSKGCYMGCTKYLLTPNLRHITAKI